MKTDEIISYHDLVGAEKANLQKGMNFGIGKTYSVLLMSVREGAPYSDAIDEDGNLLYEGHDVPRSAEQRDPKLVDQPLTYPKGSWTENGKFYRAAMDFKGGLRKQAELVKATRRLRAEFGATKASSS